VILWNTSNKHMNEAKSIIRGLKSKVNLGR